MAANHPRYARRQAERRAERDEFRGKRQRVSRRPMSGVELLNTRLFGMEPATLVRQTPTLAAAPAQFNSAGQYYACMQELVVEEARAAVAEGLLQQREGRPYMLEMDAEPEGAGGGSPRSSKQGGSLESVRVRVEQVADMQRLRDACRAGGVWLLATTDASGSGSGGGGGGRGGGGGGGRGGGGRHRAAATLSDRYVRGDGRLAGIDGRGGGLDSSGLLALEMPAASAAAVRLAAGANRGGRVAAWCVASLLAEQRMCDVCQRQPSPDYMYQILGERTCEHIVFNNSSSDEEETEHDPEPTTVTAGSEEEEEGESHAVVHSGASTEAADAAAAEQEEEEEEQPPQPQQVAGLRAAMITPAAVIEAAWRDLNPPQRAAAADFAGQEDPEIAAAAAALLATEAAAAASSSAYGGQGQLPRSPEAARLKGSSKAAGSLQLLHGPPGTGKTTTIVALLQAMHCGCGGGAQAHDRKKGQSSGGGGGSRGNQQGGPRTLVCAPSNRGVAELLTRFLLTATPRDSSLGETTVFLSHYT
jgi:hypothetical protein